MAQYITGYVVPTDIMRKYLADGHGMTSSLKPATLSPPPTERGDKEECSDDEEESEEEERSEEQRQASHEAMLFGKYKLRFRRVRNSAPPEVRAKLEIPSMVIAEATRVVFRRKHFFIHTGAFKKGQRGQRMKPNEQDKLAIRTFVDVANSLLPDDDARTRAGFQLEDMQFHVIPENAVWTPIYSGQEIKDLTELRRWIATECSR